MIVGFSVVHFLATTVLHVYVIKPNLDIKPPLPCYSSIPTVHPLLLISVTSAPLCLEVKGCM